MSRFKFLLPAILLTFLSAAALAAPKAAFSNAKVVSVHSNVSQAVADGTHCNEEDLDGYCQEIIPISVVENDIVVQQADGSTLNLACPTDGKASDCAGLSPEQTVSTRPVRNGVEVRYRDASNRVHQQLYRVVRTTDMVAAGE